MAVIDAIDAHVAHGARHSLRSALLDLLAKVADRERKACAEVVRAHAAFGRAMGKPEVADVIDMVAGCVLSRLEDDDAE